MNCKICGKKSEKEYCFQHKPRKRMITHSQSNKKEISESNIIQRNDLFISIWNKRPHKSEISGEVLMSPPLSAYFHHIIRKESFEEGKYDEENIILLSLHEHLNAENDMYRYEEINKRRKYLKQKYDLV